MMTAMKKHLTDLNYPAPRTISKLEDQVRYEIRLSFYLLAYCDPFRFSCSKNYPKSNTVFEHLLLPYRAPTG
jgi:hypothetical protein